MTQRDDRRRAIVEAAADHMLGHGIAASSLRALAASAGTSDRMLLYYFRDRDELLAAVLEAIAQRLIAGLDRRVLATPARTPARLATELWAVLREPEKQAFTRIWIELAGMASAGLEPQRGAAAMLIEGFLEWAASRLAGRTAALRRRRAALVLTVVDGAMLLDAGGRGDIASTAISALASSS